VLISVMGKHKARACTHLDVSAEQVAEAAAVIRAIAA
jgi:threonine aldolase